MSRVEVINEPRSCPETEKIENDLPIGRKPCDGDDDVVYILYIHTCLFLYVSTIQCTHVVFLDFIKILQNTAQRHVKI